MANETRFLTNNVSCQDYMYKLLLGHWSERVFIYQDNVGWGQWALSYDHGNGLVVFLILKSKCTITVQSTSVKFMFDCHITGCFQT